MDLRSRVHQTCPTLPLVLGVLATFPGLGIISYSAISSDESTSSSFRVSKNILSPDKACFRLPDSGTTIPFARKHHVQTSVRLFAKFRSCPDSEVSPRYRYGELRLGRLNFWAKIFLRRFVFHKVQTHYAYNVYFARFYAPIIFLFAFFTVILSAMQVDLTVNPPSDQDNPVGWKAFGTLSRWFGVVAIACAVTFSAGLLALLGFMAAREIVFALK